MTKRTRDDYRALIKLFAISRDNELEKFAVVCEKFFEDDSFQLSEVSLSTLSADIATFFPAPFAKTFVHWQHEERADLAAAIESGSDRVHNAFRASFDGIWTCWKQIVRFLPFVLLAPLSRPRDNFPSNAKKRLSRIVAYYQDYYQLSDNEKSETRVRYEIQQRYLLRDLITLCQDFAKNSSSNTTFFFSALGSSSQIFPARFSQNLEFLQKARNRVEHGELWQRESRYVTAMADCIEMVFLDVLAGLTPLCRTYGLYYVEEVEQIESTLKAVTWPFDASAASAARFYLHNTGPGQPSVYKFVPKNIYFIDRSKRCTDEGPVTPLAPKDYINLTPFIIDQARIDEMAQHSRRGLFSLDEYSTSECNRFVRFFEFAGAASLKIPSDKLPSDFEVREANELLKDIDEFIRFVQSFSGAKISRRRTGTDFSLLRRYIWERVSKPNLSSVIDMQSFGPSGEYRTLDLNVSPIVNTYDPELYVAPAQVAELEKFFTSDKRGLLLIGASGFGKTTLLASYFLERLRAGDLAMFLSGRTLAEATLREILNARAGSIGHDWQFSDLDMFVKEENEARLRLGKQPATQITIFIDAINEYTAGKGAEDLLRELVALTNTGGDTLFGSKLGAVRIIATCRTETWLGYRAGFVFDSTNFYCSSDGLPITVSGFDDDTIRRTLFERYRHRYALQSTRYESLPSSVTDLFRSPLILALIAATYGHRDGTPGVTIPRDLDYFKVFFALRQRKFEDARKLIPHDSQRIHVIDREILNCMQTFAKLLYERLIADESPKDYVGVEQTTWPPMAEYSERRSDCGITPFQAAREINLIVGKTVAERDWTGIELQGEAYTFFHDRYAEFELAGVLINSALGPLTPARVGNTSELQALVSKIEFLLRRAVNFPVLSGAVDHWFQINLNMNGDQAAIDAVITLCNSMSQSEFGSVRTKAADVLTSLVLRGSLKAELLFSRLAARATKHLHIDMAMALAHAWPDSSAEMIRAFLESCDPHKHSLAIEAISHTFAEHANLQRLGGDGSSAVAFIGEICGNSLDFVLRLRNRVSTDIYLAFLLNFSIVTIVTCSHQPSILTELQAVLLGRLGFLAKLLSKKWVAKPIQVIARNKLDESLFAAWENSISTDGVNDTFFIEDYGLVQREVFFEFLPYLCAVHNRDYELMRLDEDGPFRILIEKMLNYRKYSILGFAAYLSVTIAFRGDKSIMLEFLQRLMKNGTDAGQFVAINIIETFCQIYPETASEALEFVRAKMLPQVLNKGLALPHLLICAGGIVEISVEENWHLFLPILDAAFAYLDKRDSERIAFCKEMRCLSFFADKRVSTKFIQYLIDSGYNNPDSPWHEGLLHICAGMLIGRREELRNLIDESAYRQAEALWSQEIIDQERTFGSRARWNPFFVRIFAFDTKFRYLVTKFMLGPIALCNSVDEWAVQMGAFLLEAIRTYSSPEKDTAKRYERLTIEDIYATTPWRPRPGAGKAYIPRAKRS